MMESFIPNKWIIFVILGILVAISHATNDNLGTALYPNAQLTNVPELRFKQFRSEAMQMKENLKNIGRKTCSYTMAYFKVVLGLRYIKIIISINYRIPDTYHYRQT